MCLGTVILSATATSPERRFADVVSLACSGEGMRLHTLFDETHDLPGVRLGSIDLAKGVTIRLIAEEKTP